MPMTVVVTTALPDRFRGFLASCMCEVAPGVFTSPNMSDGVRQRVWGVPSRACADAWCSPSATTIPARTPPPARPSCVQRGPRNAAVPGSPPSAARVRHERIQ